MPRFDWFVSLLSQPCGHDHTESTGFSHDFCYGASREDGGSHRQGRQGACTGRCHRHRLISNLYRALVFVMAGELPLVMLVDRYAHVRLVVMHQYFVHKV